MRFRVKFKIGKKKMLMEVSAESVAEAEQTLKNKLIIDSVEPVSPKTSESKQYSKNYGKDLDFESGLFDALRSLGLYK